MVGFTEMTFQDPKPVPDKPVSVILDERRLIEYHLLCPDHDLRLRLVYNKQYDSLYYRCPNYTLTDCSGTIGAHKNTGEPLGWPCDKETKAARQRAHQVFDLLWQSGSKTRNQAYRWMQKVMGLTAEQAHIGKFDKAQCHELVQLVHREFGSF